MRITFCSGCLVLIFSTLSFAGNREKLWGVAYSAWRDRSTCAISEADIDSDFAKIAGVATAVRIYGFDCDFPGKILKLAKKHGLKVLLGLWLDGNEGQYQGQKNALEALLRSTPDMSHVVGISVGNEVLHRNEMSEGALIGKIQDIRNSVRSRGYSTPVTTVDVFDKYSNNLARNVDILVPNLHTFFSNSPVDSAPDIVFDLVKRIKSMSGAAGKDLIVGETGWPSGGNNGAANQVNEWKYMKKFHCRANGEKLKYFYFEAFDAVWKGLGNGNIESHWGLGEANRQWKGGLDAALEC